MSSGDLSSQSSLISKIVMRKVPGSYLFTFGYEMIDRALSLGWVNGVPSAPPLRCQTGAYLVCFVGWEVNQAPA